MSARQTTSCHCGAMKAAVDLDPHSEPALMCNCSICARSGARMRFVPEAAIEVLSAGAPTDYQFNGKNVHHLFCSTCGMRPWGHGKGGDGKRMYMVNLNCIEDLDLQSLDIKQVDGKSL